MISKNDLQKAFNERAESLSLYQTSFEARIENLRMGELKRAVTAILRYPVPSEKKHQSDEEHDVTKLGIAISETKQEMATISAAMSELEKM